MILDRQNEPSNEQGIQRFEEKKGVRLPADYRKFLLEFNGGRPVAENATWKTRGSNFLDVDEFYGLTDSSLNLSKQKGSITFQISCITGCSRSVTRTDQACMWIFEKGKHTVGYISWRAQRTKRYRWTIRDFKTKMTTKRLCSFIRLPTLSQSS